MTAFFSLPYNVRGLFLQSQNLLKRRIIMATFFNQATLSYNGNTITSNVTTGEIVEVLSAEKTAILPTYEQGGDITYVISIVNAGTTPYTALTITDNLGEYAFGTGTVVPLTYKTGSVRYFINGVLQPAPTVTDDVPFTVTGINVPANSNTLIIYEADVNGFAPLASGSVITNEAVISGSGLTNDIIVTETVAVADAPLLSITKSLSPTVVNENGQITYTLTIVNNGNTPIVATDDVVVSDTFDPILSDITVTLNGVTLGAGDYSYNEATGEFVTTAGVVTVPAAAYTQGPDGEWVVTPGTAVITITGTI